MCAAEIPSNLCRFRGQTRPSRDFCGTAALSLKPDIGWRGGTSEKCQKPTWVYLFAFANGLVSSWVQLMTSCAAGLSTRFFKVRIPTGPLTIGSAIGNFLMNGCLTGNVNTIFRVDRKIAARSEQVDRHFEALGDHGRARAR